MKSFLILALALLGQPVFSETKKVIKIGFSMDTLKEERWQRDRDSFVKKAKELGAEVLVQAANGNDALQLSQSENLLTQGVDILVVAPHNGVAAAQIVKVAHKAGIKVLAYDRMIENADVDLYMSFDNEEVGRMQARYLLEKAPKGNYMVLGGAPTDYNAKLYRKGQMDVLQPAVNSGAIKIVADPWAREWLASEALKHTENTLTKVRNDLVAVVAPNDGTAGGVVAALKGQKLEGKVFVSGQDAELAACQRVVDGSQTMTVYKPIPKLAERAAEIAFQMANGDMSSVAATKQTINNGKKAVPSILIAPILVDQKNMDSTVVKDGFHTAKDVFKNVNKKTKSL
ncbi:MAG: D-xylose ABC transporter substrate-binding protein [Bdellovibrionales bacterium]|nr:D-xylose ABC transporter substrate-binding protein [Bdellovibrionales bacterium]